MVGLSLGEEILLCVKPMAQLRRMMQKPLIFRRPFIGVSRKHPVISQNNSCPCKERNHSVSGKIIHNNKNKRQSHGKAPQ